MPEDPIPFPVDEKSIARLAEKLPRRGADGASVKKHLKIMMQNPSSPRARRVAYHLKHQMKELETRERNAQSGEVLAILAFMIIVVVTFSPMLAPFVF